MSGLLGFPLANSKDVIRKLIRQREEIFGGQFRHSNHLIIRDVCEDQLPADIKQARFAAIAFTNLNVHGSYVKVYFAAL